MNKERELHISKCKAEFREFAKSHKYLLRHVKKEITCKLAETWLAEAKRLEDFRFDGSDEQMAITETRIKELRDHATQVCKTGKPLGTIIVFYDADGLRVGFAKVHNSDRYNRHIGICRAIKDSYGEVDRDIPRGLQVPMTKMVNFAESGKGMSILLGETEENQVCPKNDSYVLEDHDG